MSVSTLFLRPRSAVPCGIKQIVEREGDYRREPHVPRFGSIGNVALLRGLPVLRIARLTRSLLFLASVLLVACAPRAAPLIATPTIALAPSRAPAPTLAVSAGREEARVPFPPPASCRAVTMDHAEQRRTFPAYWYDGNGIALGNATAVFYQHDNKVMWQVQGDATPVISGERIDGTAAPMAVQNLGLTPSGFISGVVFPTTGCWHIHATAGAYRLDADFYVYPSGCLPATMRDPGATIAPCTPPTGP